MLILIVVIAILTTNLFLGFFIAHYLGYGPQNFEELWTGVYGRPAGPIVPTGDSNPDVRVIVDALTQAAADRPLLPNDAGGSSDLASPHQLPDHELVRAMLHANMALHQAGLLIDRVRLIHPQPPAKFAGFPPLVWDAHSHAAGLATWRDWLQSASPAEEVGWWKAYVATWLSTHQAFEKYQRSLLSLRRVQDAELNFSQQQTTVVCEDGSCRLVHVQPTNTAWWKRPPAELKTLAWVHGQLDQLHQEAFDHFVLFRTESRRLNERTLAWVRQTFKPERLIGWAAQFDQRWSWAGLSAAITGARKQDGFVFVVATHVDWVAEFGIGSVVADAVVHHRTECLNRWFDSVPTISTATILPLRETVHDRATAVWISSEDPESAQIAAWTIADKLELSHRMLGHEEVHLPCRVLVVPLSKKRPAMAGIRQAMQILNDLDHALWNSGNGIVWSLEKRGPQPVPRPDALPLVESAMSLAQWYVGWRLGIGFTMPVRETSAAESLSPLSAEQKLASANAAPTDNGGGTADPPPVDDDGIDW